MAVDFDAMLGDALDTLGTAGTYTPQSGDAFTLQVMPAREDVLTPFFGQTRLKSDAAVFEARVAAFASPPAAGDTLTYRSTAYTVKTFRYLDPERLLYLLDCAPP